MSVEYGKKIRSNSTSGTHIKRLQKSVKKNTSNIKEISHQQSQQWKRSHSVKPSTIQPTIEASSINKIDSLNNNSNQTPSELLSDQYICCRCSLIRIAICVFTIFILLSGFAALIVALYNIKPNTTTTNESIISTTTSTTLTMSSSLTTTTSTNTTTTTIATICGSSCLNQSWIDSSGVIAFWKFENSFADSTNIYNGTPSSQAPTFVSGYVGQAASFNATAKQSIYTSFIPLSNVSFTLDAWIEQNGEPNPTDYSIVGLCLSTTTDNCLHISIRSKKYYFGFYGDDLQSSATMPLNYWVHVAFVFDVTTRKQMIYVNGFLDQQRTASGTLKLTSRNFTIGTNLLVRLPNNTFQGYIDQLSINARSKSSCEILEIATLAAHFKFDVTSPLSDSGPNSMISTASNYLIISGYKNQAISFSGASTSYYQVSSFTSFGITNQSFSITFWIQPQILSGTIVHLSTSSLGTGSQCFPLLGFTSNRTIIAQILTKNNTVVSITGPILSVSSSWIAVGLTWSQTNGLKLYINKTLINSMIASTFLASKTTSNYLTLGNCLNGCSGCFNGSIDAVGPFTGAIDDWRIYSRELSSNDICTLYSY
ncbi:unnamed protein product [Rotaria sordida]|uniref:LamG-like jellyroll fold domain-containing protein n=1 Tax=Rotaria sordida TaxID=392033 RepID=A0A815DCS4_9BILA|nr:unnamed protein product [Rotaria sordida]CAF1570135.1 unnamed protein product [Rotaria sordida]